MSVFSAETIHSAKDSPTVLCMSGHDPTGGAGVQADIECINAHGVRALTLVTSLTAQDTCDVVEIYPQDPQQFEAQANCLLRDIPVDVFKIGLLGSAEIATVVASIIRRFPDVPVVLDPVLAAGGGHDLVQGLLMEVLIQKILPRTTLVTPNSIEARRLSGLDTLDASAKVLMTFGCPNVLITGSHEEGPKVINRWYGPQGQKDYAWQRLPQHYHGSGCTLASSIAAGLALKMPIERAIERGQQYTYSALSSAESLGQGQWLPLRR